MKPDLRIGKSRVASLESREGEGPAIERGDFSPLTSRYTGGSPRPTSVARLATRDS